MARIKIKNKNSLPKGYTIRKGKCIKTYEAGGATVSNTLSPVDRDAANLEAEKNEMVLTDTTGDGVFELYGVGGKRHSEGGTPLNLPDQSFVYSDTRGMLLTKDEMKSLGIESKKRLTPAKAAKKFPLNKFIKILEDETSDKIAVETAEQMIGKNKIMLSQIAFIQESKKDFEGGLPLAAFPYLMSKGVNPEEFQQKIMEMKAEKEGQAAGPTHQMPDGSTMPGATHGEAMGMAQGMPPQGMPPMGPPQGGGMPPQGMMPPAPPTNIQADQMMMGRYGGDLHKFKAGAEMDVSVVPAETTPAESPMGKLAGIFQGFKKSTYSDVENNTQSGGDGEEAYLCPAYGNPPPSASQMQAMTATPTFAQYGTELTQYQTQGELLKKAEETIKKRNEGVPFSELFGPSQTETPNANTDPRLEMAQDFINKRNAENTPDGVPPVDMMEVDLITKCKNSVCTYDEWRFAFRLRDIEEIRFMYESYKTKAIDKMKASDTDTDIMPGHENLPQQQYGTETGQPMVPQMGVPEGYVRDQNPLGLPGYRRGGGYYEDEGVGLSTFVQGGAEIVNDNSGIPLDPLVAPYEQNPYYADLGNKLKMMQQDYNSALKYREENPHKFDKKAQEEFANSLSILQNQMMSIDYEMKIMERKLSLDSSMLDIQTSSPNVEIADVSEYTGVNPAMQGTMMAMAKNGMELPRYELGDHVCVGDNCTDGGEDEHNDQKHKLQNKGIDAHMQFQNMINSEDFALVKKGWLEAYRALENNYKAAKKKKDEKGKLTPYEKQLIKNPPILGKSDADLVNGFMAINQKLMQSSHAGIPVDDWKASGSGYKAICEKLGWGDCDKGNERGNEGNKIWQGMFVAMQHLKGTENSTPEADRFFGNITTNLEGKHQKGNSMIDPITKKPMSHIDGVLGWTSAGQGMGVENEITEKIITHDVPCDKETREKKEKECAEKARKNPKAGWIFDLEICNCKTQPGDPEIKETPPYMTFPQDDLKLQNAIDSKWQRELYMPQRMHEDAIIPEVAYQDPQAQIQANLSLAGQMANMDPENASYYMGLISDKNNKAISDVANTNIKIFDNNQARVASALSANQTANTGYKDEYNTRSATALNNWDNTRIADNENITNTQVDRMDHADKLFAINNENPNFYYDAQAHRNQFYNPEDMFVQDELDTNVSMSDAVAACRKMNFTNEAQILACAKQMRSGNSTESPQREDIVRDDNKDTKETPAKHGKEIGCTSCDNDKRRKELARSKKALRDWIFGI